MAHFAKDLTDSLMKGNICPVVGAGMSAAVISAQTNEQLFPTWTEFMELAAEELDAQHPDNPSHANFVRACAGTDSTTWTFGLSYAKQHLEFNWNDLLRRVFAKDISDATQSSLANLRKLWNLKSSIILTTNFDMSLKWASNTPSDVRIINPSMRVEFAATLRKKTENQTVIHLHGSIDNVETVVLSMEDYEKNYEPSIANPVMMALNQLPINNIRFLFVGYSLRDPKLTTTLEEMLNYYPGELGGHYALVPENQVERIRSLKAKIKPIPYDSHEHLSEILTQLTEIASGNQNPRLSVEKIVRPKYQASIIKKSSDCQASMSLKNAYDQYLYAEMVNNSRRPSTIGNSKRGIDRWQQFEKHKCKEPRFASIDVRAIDTKLLAEFQNWLVLNGGTPKNAAASVGTVISVLRCLSLQGMLTAVPLRPRIAVRSSKQENYPLEYSTVERIWNAALKLKWPTRDDSKNIPNWSPSDYWRGAIIMYMTYAFRTQELISHERGFRALFWGDVEMNVQQISPSACSYGYLSYVPDKTKRLKPAPIQLALTKHAFSVLSRLRPESPSRDDRVFNAPMSSVAFYKCTRELAAQAGIKNARGGLPSMLRKFAIHQLERHYPGITQYILGTVKSDMYRERFTGKYGNQIFPVDAIAECYLDYDPFPFFEDY